MKRDVAIPRRMRALQRDARGYPVPYVILRDTDNRPHFTINDDRRRNRCLRERRCQICGNRLDPLLWFVGGPRSAFDPHGWYNDTAMHHECMKYAMQVCPYLAAPAYFGRIDTVTLDPAKLPKGCPAIFFDATQIPERPPVFVAVASAAQEIATHPPYYVRPVRPYAAVEYWHCGALLTPEAAAAILLAAEQG